jgi:hypothetical protein
VDLVDLEWVVVVELVEVQVVETGAATGVDWVEVVEAVVAIAST